MSKKATDRVVDVEVPAPATFTLDIGLFPPIRKQMEDFPKYCEKLGWAMYSFATLNTLVTNIVCKYKYHDDVDRRPAVHRLTSSERIDVDERVAYLQSLWEGDENWKTALERYREITQLRNALYHSQRLPDNVKGDYLVRHHAHSDHKLEIQAWDAEGKEISHSCDGSEHNCGIELIRVAWGGGSWTLRPALWESFVIDEDWLKAFIRQCHEVHSEIHGCWIRLDSPPQENGQ